jgi:predicted nucleic acid-binding protein
MNKIILLDASPLGTICNPKHSVQTFACAQWAEQMLQQGEQIAIPEIADYEVRRELIRGNKTRSVTRLNQMKLRFDYLPITTAVMLRAAEFWAQARNMGKPTAGNQRWDADVILAAQASLLLADGDDVVIATANVAHLSLFVPAARWQDIA